MSLQTSMLLDAQHIVSYTNLWTIDVNILTGKETTATAETSRCVVQDAVFRLQKTLSQSEENNTRVCELEELAYIKGEKIHMITIYGGTITAAIVGEFGLC